MLDEPTTIRFPLKEAPKFQRLEMAKEVVGRSIMNMDFTPLPGDPAMAFEFRMLPSVVISDERMSPFWSASGYDPSRDNDDLMPLWANSPIKGSMRQFGKEQQSDGSAVLLSCADPHVGVVAQRDLRKYSCYRQ